MNYLVLKQRIYLVISVLTLIVLGSSYGSAQSFQTGYLIVLSWHSIPSTTASIWHFQGVSVTQEGGLNN